MKTRHATEHVLLGAMMCGARYGYEMLQFLEDTLGSTWRVSTSQLYSLLKRLEEEGLVKSKIKPQDTRPSKRIFSLTSEGRSVFRKWLKTPCQHVRDMRVEFLAKIFFIKNLSLANGKELVEKQKGLLEGSRSRFLLLMEKEMDPYRKLVLGFKLTTVDAWLKWLVTQAREYMESC